MSSQYDRRRQGREAQRQRSLMGETLAQFHERETAKPTLGDRLPRARCKATDDLFSAPRPQLFDKIGSSSK